MRVGNRLNRKVIRTVAKIPEPFVTGHIRASVTSSMRAPRDPHPHSLNGDLAVFHIVAHQPSGVLLLALPHRLSFLRHFRMSPGFRYRIVYPHVKPRINRKAIHPPSTGSLPTAPPIYGHSDYSWVWSYSVPKYFFTLSCIPTVSSRGDPPVAVDHLRQSAVVEVGSS